MHRFLLVTIIIFAFLVSYRALAQDKQVFDGTLVQGQEAKHTDPPATLNPDGEFGKHYDLAHHYLSRLDLELADLEIQQAIVYEPKAKFAHRFCCFLSILRGNFPRAVAEFMMATGLGQSIPLTVHEKTTLDQLCAKAHYRKGLSYEAQHRYPRAIDELSLAYEYVPYPPETLPIMRSLAFNYGKAGLVDYAEKFYKDSFAMSKQPSVEDAFAYADYAYLLASVHRYDEAIEQLTKAVQLAPGSAALHIDLSLFQEQAGSLEQATHQMQLAIKTAPEYALHDLQFSQGTQRKNNFLGWQMHHSDKSRPTYASLWEHLGRLLDKQDKLTGARKAYTRALLLDAEDGLVKTRLSELQKQPPIKYASSAVVKDMEAKNHAVI